MTKVSGLAAAAALLSTHELGVNEAGTSKKVTGAQVRAFAIANLGASAYMAAAQSLVSGVPAALHYDTTLYTDGNLDIVTNKGRYTVPAGGAGKYLVIGGCTVAAAPPILQLYLYKNGVLFKNISPLVAGAQAYGSAIIKLAVADYIEVWAYQNAATQNTAPGATTCWLDIQYLGS